MTIQPGILPLGASEHNYLEFDLREKAQPYAVLQALYRVLNHSTTHGANLVVGVRPSLWAQLVPDKRGAGLRDFSEEIVGRDGFTMPATQRDLWVWISGSDRSVVFDAATFTIDSLHSHTYVRSDTAGWVYHSTRDLTGFEDGTENPPALEAPGVIEIPAGQLGAGGSVLLFQLWSHTSKWRELDVASQEGVIGRTKADSVELDDDVKPETSHVARTVVEVEGEEMEIFRRNTAYGTATDHGTVFVGFSVDQWRQETMLRRMAGVDGVRDALTRFTTPESGAWYFVPSVESLADFAPIDDEA